MSLIIVSNRAPVTINRRDDGSLYYKPSVGGLATGLYAYVERMKDTKQKNGFKNITWVGWPGASVDNEDKVRKDILKKFGVYSVFLSEEVMEKFYQGFCNKTIWPLFHYFPGRTEYDMEFWEQYVLVNQIYCDAVLSLVKPNDTIWVHDYHLMLLPLLIRNKLPNANIGFFLHIPFPAYEVFRLLPREWRKQILEGLYGADLVGFHTHDYRTYFLRSSLRILGLQHSMGEVFYDQRLVKADTFPMGIDFAKYHGAAGSKEVKKNKDQLKNAFNDFKVILSVDRQDYSKGIVNRLKGYEHFLEYNPHWREKVVMAMVVVPSRSGVENYQVIKSQIDELVGSINSKYGKLHWTPILYQYRSLPFDELIALYNLSDVALVTPLRDGMNLVAKEYIACRTPDPHQRLNGVLVLSEMAGSVDGLDDALIINPNNVEEISHSLKSALEMEAQEQDNRMQRMQKRVHDYDVFRWADDFLTTLGDIKKRQARLGAKILTGSETDRMVSNFKKSAGAIFFLDYDGTLVPHRDNPADAYPPDELLELLEKMLQNKKVRIVLISGRDRQIMDKWFGHLPVDIATEHGVMLKERGKKWRMLKPVRRQWKKKILPVMKYYAERLPGSFVEEKDFALAFHYRKSNPEYASLRVKELMSYLASFTANMDLQMLNGNKVLEVRSAGIDKGVAAMHWLSLMKQSYGKRPQFILSMGDDWTDEDLFRAMPRNAYSVKIGIQASHARFNLKNPTEAVGLLRQFT